MSLEFVAHDHVPLSRPLVISERTNERTNERVVTSGKGDSIKSRVGYFFEISLNEKKSKDAGRLENRCRKKAGIDERKSRIIRFDA